MRRLPVIDVAAAGLRRGLTSLPYMVAIFSAPFLLAIILEIALSLVLTEMLSDSRPLQFYIVLRPWLSLAFWGASMAMVYMALLRWVLHDEVRPGLLQLDFSRATLLAMPVVAVWFLVDHLVQNLPVTIYSMMMSARQYSVLDTSESLNTLNVLHAAAWAIRLVLSFLCFSWLVIIVQHERINIAEYFRLLGLQPVRVFLVVVLAGVLMGGMRLLYSNTADFLGIGEYIVARDVQLVMSRKEILPEIVNMLPLYFFNFLSFLIQIPPIAEAYGWVLGQKRRIPAAIVATFT